VGDAALLVEPNDVDALADALERALTESELRAQLVARGREQVRKFPWARALDELVALYRHVAE
jgi:glycosyltransferase involved in cell wall biosynthesis